MKVITFSTEEEKTLAIEEKQFVLEKCQASLAEIQAAQVVPEASGADTGNGEGI